MIAEKKAVQRLKPYVALDVPAVVKLDANEGQNILFPNGFGTADVLFQRYPDDKARLLRTRLSESLGVPFDWIVEGNGSSELIELLIKTYVEAGEVILSFEPTFSMYRVYAELYGATYAACPVEADFGLDVDRLIEMEKKLKPKLLFLCSPNNPTGRVIPRDDILRIVEASDALVVVDEAYIEFAEPSQSVLPEVSRYDNLALLRTFSKAYGLAAIRLGYLVAQKTIVDSIAKVKSPYHVNQLSQAIGAKALQKRDIVSTYAANVRVERSALAMGLQKLGFQVTPSAANFLWVRSPVPELFESLVRRGVLIRAYKDPYRSYYRITVGTAQENQILMQSIREILDETIR